MAKLLDALTAKAKQTAAEREAEQAELRTAYDAIICRSDRPGKGDVEEIQRLAEALGYEPDRIAADVQLREDIVGLKAEVAELPRIVEDVEANGAEREKVERESKDLERRDRDRMANGTMLSNEHRAAREAEKKLAKLRMSPPGLCAD